MRIKRSKIWLLEKECLQKIIDESSSITNVLLKLDFNPYNGNHRTLMARIKEDKLDLSILEKNRKLKTKEKFGKLRKNLTDEEIFISDSKKSGQEIKKLILQRSKLEYKCSNCEFSGEWCGLPLSLQLDHKNGVNSDNRLENLRFLCPNCHSQTETFGGKNAKKYNRDKFGNKEYIKECKLCSEEIIVKSSDVKFCKKCLEIRRKELEEGQKRFNPSVEELKNKILELKGNLRALGRFYNVTDNAVRKRIILFKFFEKKFDSFIAYYSIV